MKTYEVLKDFKYSPNGIQVVKLKKGDSAELSDERADKRIKAGYVADITTKETEEEPEKQDEAVKTPEVKPEVKPDTEPEVKPELDLVKQEDGIQESETPETPAKRKPGRPKKNA